MTSPSSSVPQSSLRHRQKGRSGAYVGVYRSRSGIEFNMASLRSAGHDALAIASSESWNRPWAIPQGSGRVPEPAVWCRDRELGAPGDELIVPFLLAEGPG